MRLERKILIGFVIGAAFGLLSQIGALSGLRAFLIAIEPIGTIFIRLVTMVVVPLVIASVFVGITSLGDVRSLGRVGSRTIAYFAATTLAAAIIGLFIGLATNVGLGGLHVASNNVQIISGVAYGHVTAAQAAALQTAPPSISQTLIGMIPQNPFASAAGSGGDLLPLIIAVCIFAAATTVVERDKRQIVVDFFDGINRISMVVVRWLMQLAPVAVGVLIAAAIARFGVSVLDQLLLFALVVVAALVVHVAAILMPMLYFGARVGIGRFYRATADALLLAFSTSSSNAALPVSMTAAQERLGVPQRVVEFVLPPGASMNKNGSAAYKAVAVLFICHLYGFPLTVSGLITVVAIGSIAAFAGAGVPGSSLVTTLIVLNAVGLGERAASGIALVAAIDRPLDMCRTTVNTIGNLVGAAWIGRAEGSPGPT